MNRVAAAPALPNNRTMVKAGKAGRDGHALAFSDTLAALGRIGDRSGHPPPPRAAEHLPNWRGEVPGGSRAQDAGRADPADAGPREGKSTRSDADGTKAAPWPGDSAQPTLLRDDTNTEPSMPPKDPAAEAQAQATAPGVPNPEPPPNMVRASLALPSEADKDVAPAGAGLGRQAALASPGTPPAPTATGTIGRLDARDRVLTGNPGNAAPLPNPAGPTQAARAPGSTLPPASESLAEFPEIPPRTLVAHPLPAAVAAAGPGAGPVPRFAAVTGVATPSGRDLAAATPGTTDSGRTAAQDAGIAARQPGTDAPAAALASWLVAGGPSQTGVAFRATFAPNGSLTGKAGMVGLPTAQANAASDASDPIPPPAGWSATPHVAGMAAPTTAPPEFAAGVLAMPPPASGRPAAGSARAMTIEGAEPAAAAASRAGSDPNAVLQTDAAAVSGSTDIVAPAPAHPTHQALPMLPASVADQVAPVMLSAIRNGGAGHRVTVSITPGELGQVNVTVERNSNGTMHIQVSAEHLATLELLRRGQDELTQALNQAIDDRSGHSLSFSLDRGMDGDKPGSGMGSWFTQSGQQDARPPIPQTAYADDTAVVTPANSAAASRGGIDVTA